MDRLEISFSFEWVPVLMRDKVEYLFPLGITPFMRAKYREPCVFRWNIYQKKPGDKRMYYPGEAQELCPRRLYGYLDPGPTQQGQRRVKMELQRLIREGMNVGLDICQVHDLKYGEAELGQEALHEKYIRLMIQAAVTAEQRRRGDNILEI